MTTYSTGKKQTIVEFESLAWKYDDLFSRSRIGTQRGTVWEVFADVFRPGNAILVLNCRTREDEIFLALLDVSVVARDAAEEVIQAELRSGRTFDGALANFSGLHGITNFIRLLVIWHSWLLPSSFAFLPGSAFQRRFGFSSMANIATLFAEPLGWLP